MVLPELTDSFVVAMMQLRVTSPLFLFFAMGVGLSGGAQHRPGETVKEISRDARSRLIVNDKVEPDDLLTPEAG